MNPKESPMTGKKDRDGKDVEYRAPGETAWHPVNAPENQAPRPRPNLRALARGLLEVGDDAAREALKRYRRSRSELASFERDMAAAMGAWERFVEAGAKKLFFDAEEAIKEIFPENPRRKR